METYRQARIIRGKPDVPTSWLAEAIGLSRKMLGRTEPPRESERRKGDADLKEKIVCILHDFPCYGYRRVTPALKRAGTQVNKKRVARVMKENGLAQKQRRRFTKTTDSTHRLPTYPNLVRDIVPGRPRHVWAADITYVRLAVGFCYVALIIDTFTRKVAGWAVETHMETSLVMHALTMALAKGAPEFHHSDRGGQYCAREYVELLSSRGVKIIMADAGLSVDNPYAESLNRTLKVEEVYLKEYHAVEDARASIKCFIEDVYNTKRLHSSLGYVPPEEFEERWLNEHVAPRVRLRSDEHVVSLSA